MCIRKKKDSLKDTESLFKSKLIPLYVDTVEGQVNLSERVNNSLKRSNVESDKINDLQEQYRILNEKLASINEEIEKKTETKTKLVKEVKVLKQMFVANQLDIEEFNKIHQQNESNTALA